MRLFLNEYYRRKPERLWEKDGDVFCMAKNEEYDYEFLSVDLHESELKKRDAEIEELKNIIKKNLELDKKVLDKAESLQAKLKKMGNNTPFINIK